jgi:Na+-translocating ferredoxin:NAD+ oxidoreductase RnfG subunit
VRSKTGDERTEKGRKKTKNNKEKGRRKKEKEKMRILKFRKTILILALILAICFPISSFAAVCVFRFPDRDVYKLYPKATNYKSVLKKVDKTAKVKIEALLGQSLEADETELTFYEIYKSKDLIGMIHPHAERGEYGTIEVVWAFAPDGKIIDFTIQRDREKKGKELNSPAFRKQFTGKDINFPFTIEKTREINSKLIKPVDGAEKGSSAIAYGAKKTLAFYKFLFQEVK